MKSANLCWSSFSLSCCRCTSSFRHCKENIIKQPVSFFSGHTNEDLYRELYFSSFRGRGHNWDKTSLKLLLLNINVKQSSWWRVSRITVILFQMSGILPWFWQQLILNASKGEISNKKLDTSIEFNSYPWILLPWVCSKHFLGNLLNQPCILQQGLLQAFFH